MPRRLDDVQVALFIPNLIGYFRLLLLVSALLIGTGVPQLTYWIMLITLLLDGLDGIAARRLCQASTCYVADRKLPALVKWLCL